MPFALLASAEQSPAHGKIVKLSSCYCDVNADLLLSPLHLRGFSGIHLTLTSHFQGHKFESISSSTKLPALAEFSECTVSFPSLVNPPIVI